MRRPLLLLLLLFSPLSGAQPISDKLASLDKIQNQLSDMHSEKKDEDLDQKLKFLDQTLSQLNNIQGTPENKKGARKDREADRLREQFQQQQQLRQAQSAREYWNKVQLNNYLGSGLFQADKEMAGLLKSKEISSILPYEVKQLVGDFEKTYEIQVVASEREAKGQEWFEGVERPSDSTEEFVDFEQKIGRKGQLVAVGGESSHSVWSILNSKVLALFGEKGLERLFRLGSLKCKGIMGTPCLSLSDETPSNVTLCAQHISDKHQWLRHIETLQKDIQVNTKRV